MASFCLIYRVQDGRILNRSKLKAFADDLHRWKPLNCCLSYGLFLFNSLPYDTILDWSKLKAFADDKINVTEKLKVLLERVENIVGKGENAGYQHFLLFPQCFQKDSYTGSFKVGVV